MELKKSQIPEAYQETMEKQEAATVVGAVLAVVAVGALQLFQLVNEVATEEKEEDPSAS